METILKILGSIGFDWQVALANLVNFLIVFYLLNRFVFGKIRNVMKERQSTISKGLTDAALAETVLAEASERERATVVAATVRANEIVAEAHHRGNELVKEAESKGHLAGEAVLHKAETEIKRRQKEAQDKLATQTVSLVVEGVRRTLERELADPKRDQEFIKNLLNRPA